jgi:uncharacterized membrane protein YdjX (TVP38/TMEM64 family)
LFLRWAISLIRWGWPWQPGPAARSANFPVTWPVSAARLLSKERHVYERIHPWVVKYGVWAIIVLSAIPNPFFDIAGVAAGIAKMSLRRFLVACWIGQLIKMALFAYAGFYSLDWLMNRF